MIGKLLFMIVLATIGVIEGVKDHRAEREERERINVESVEVNDYAEQIRWNEESRCDEPLESNQRLHSKTETVIFD
jgi:hypothetical protein